MSGAVRKTWSPASEEYESILGGLRETVGACMQCGTCTASCPNWHAMDITPRAMWRMIQFGMLDEILASRTFWMCSACYMCTLRCPRGLKLTSAMAALKRLARVDGNAEARRSGAFYEAFMDDCRSPWPGAGNGHHAAVLPEAEESGFAAFLSAPGREDAAQGQGPHADQGAGRHTQAAVCQGA